MLLKLLRRCHGSVSYHGTTAVRPGRWRDGQRQRPQVWWREGRMDGNVEEDLERITDTLAKWNDEENQKDRSKLRIMRGDMSTR